MLISKGPIFVLVLIIIKDITGFQKDNPVSDNDDSSDVNSGSGQIIIKNNDKCDDVYSNYFDCSFYHKLLDLTSNEMINLATDALLQSIVPLSGLENIAIIGNDNATVNCDNVGGICFDHCQNCTIIGIKWEKCGNRNSSKPAIELCNSSNITIQNCSFQNSATQSIVLSEMSGNVTINGCTFAFNNYYADHGVAIHYLSKIQHYSKLLFTINNCNFTHNGVINSQSVVYIGPSSNKIMEYIFFINSVFLYNQGIPIYISHQNVVIAGNMLFKGNVANRGGGIFINNHTKVTYNRLYAKFINNNAWYGGALCLAKNSNSVFEGNSVVTFNNNTARYAGGALYIEDYSAIAFEGNSALTMYDNQANEGGAIYITNNSALKFNENSTVTINNNKANYGGAININNNSDVTVEENSAVTINTNQAKYRGGALYIRFNSNSTFKENSIITINYNQANFGGAIHIINSYATFEGNSTVLIDNNQANVGGALCIWYNSNVMFEGNSVVTTAYNIARYDGGAFSIWYNSDVTFKGNSLAIINNNSAKNYGGAVCINSSSNFIFEGNSTITIYNNQANFGGAIYIKSKSVLKYNENSTATINNNQAKYLGGAINIAYDSDVTFKGNSAAIFNNNQGDYGGAINIRYNSDVTFQENSIVYINNNQAVNGGAILIRYNTDLKFEGNSKVFINNNEADYGGGIYIRDNCDVKFEGNSRAIINNNQADYGGAVYILYNSNFTFEENSLVTATNNVARYAGGAFNIWYNSDVTFKGNSIAIINNNSATNYGGAVHINGNSNFIFEGNSTITIYNNQANFGGAIYIKSKCVLKYNENSTATINNNQAKYLGGAINIEYDSDVTFKGNSTVIFNNNQGNNGGAITIRYNSGVTFQGNSIVFINNNQAVYGGAILIRFKADLKFEGKSKVFINNNQADNGGGIYIRDNSDVKFEGNSTVIINNNQADYGGAIKIRYNSYLKFKGNSKVTINDNTATYFGGAIHIINCNATFEGNSRVINNNNQADYGGAVYIWYNSKVMFEGNSLVTTTNNKASYDGGAFNILYNSDVTFKENSTVTINNNQAINGGALYIQKNSSAIFYGSSVVTFDNNTACADGGALHANNNCSVKVKGNSTIIFKHNQASGDGGAIYFNNLINIVFDKFSTVILTSNTADNYGGAIYCTITHTTMYFSISEIKYSDNRAGETGNLMYIYVPKSCNASCVANINVGISNNILWQSVSDKLIATSPNALKLQYPAKCINNDSVSCEKYYMDNIMLGQEITIPACLLDYYNRPAEATQFRIIGEHHQNYYVYGSQYILISCNHSIEGISVIGNKTISDLPLNYSMFFTSHISSKSTRKSIVVYLTVELSPCHPGFLYHSKSQKCECYNNSGIVYCSGSNSAIRRGYWFGHVTGIPTVTFCPIKYCNFTCCKTTNGYHQLSPNRNNQCRLHRAGIACGSCENGYTLPYYSSECVSIDKYTMTWTLVIVILTVLYWVAIVAVVFIMMHYQINIGKLYAITYYYSIVDALLSDNSDDFPDGLYTFINSMYSITKLTPQFLGKLCFIKGISGIDQQFIHYIHPLAVAFILIVITLLARCSRRISLLLSRAIIHVICFLLLLSYTSVTTTSLLLLKYLKFSDITKVYTYLSPDAEYFHGRHLAYGIMAILCTVTVVIGLPLLLLLEPFINHKINFTKIKPILDQFQGCYKDKYRWFAAYYMICRLVIISIIIVFTSNDFTARYLLITVCAVIVLVHLMIKPYNSNILNIFDAILLLLLVLATVLLLIDVTASNLAIQVTFLLLTLPIIIVGVVCLLAHKYNIKRLLINLFYKVDDQDSNNDIDMATRNFDVIVDESMRRNATVCGMYVSIKF